MPQQGQQGNNIGNVMLPLLAAVGTGAATYYSLRNNQKSGQQQLMQQVQGLTNQQTSQQTTNQQNQ